MGPLHTILILRSLLAAFFAGLGMVLLVGGSAVFGCFALAVGVTNGALVALLARRGPRRSPSPSSSGPAVGP
jgi:hypothetical protein